MRQRREALLMRSLKKSWIRFLKWQERSREPGLTALMFIEGTLIFIIIPLSGVGMVPGFVLPAMFILFVLATLVVTSRSHWAAGVMLIAVLLSPAGAFVHAEHPSVLTEWLSLVARLLALSALSVVIARATFGPGHVTWHRVQGAIVLYMNFALFFFTLYRFLNTLVPNAFNGLPQSGAEYGSGAALLYFSFSTLTTVGYGDITPLYPLARNLANLEAVIGQLFPATLLARLVSLEFEHRRQSKSG
jgi:voltage-gated potassium channel Kch